MAGGKRKVFNRKTRNKRQNEAENTEKISTPKASRDSSSQGKKPKLEETEETEEKRPLSIQVDLTTTEPTTSIKPKLKDEDVSKKASKYVPPFSRTSKSGNTEEECGSKSTVTRSSTRKRNLLQVLADVPKQKLEFEDGNYETSSLSKSEKTTDSCASNRIEEEQEQTVEIQPAKQPKLKERVKLNRIFSFNLRGKGKKKTKKSESEPEGEEELDGNEVMEETSKEEERQETEAVEKNEKKHYQTAEEALKDETTQSESKSEREREEELDGNAAMKETLKEKERQEAKTAEKYDEKKHHQTAKEALEDESLKILKLKSVPDEDIEPKNHTNDDNNEAEHSKCSTDSKLGSKKEIPSDSIINDAKMPSVDTVIQACVDSLIQTVEAGISVDVVASDNDVLAPGPSTKKEHVHESLTIPQAEKHDCCTKVSGNHIYDGSTNGNLEKSTTAISKSRENDADQDDHNHVEDGVGDSCKAVHADTDSVVDDKMKLIETAITSSSKTNSSYGVVGDDNSSLKKLEAEPNDDNKTPGGDTEAASYSKDDIYHKKELKTGVPDVIDDHDDARKEKELETHRVDDSKTGHPDIDVIDDDDDAHKEEELETHVKDGVKTDHSDIDVVGEDDDDEDDGDAYQENKLETNVGDGSKTDHSDIDIDVSDDNINVKNLGDDEMHIGSETGCPDDIDVVGDDDIDIKNLGDDEMHTGSEMGCPDDIDVVGDDDINVKNLGDDEMHTGSEMGCPDDIDVVGDDDINVKNLGDDEMHTGSEMGCPDDIDVVGDDDINVKNLGDDEMHAGSKMGCPDDTDVVNDDDINRKSLDVINDEMHAGSKADLNSDYIDVVGDDNHLAAVDNPLCSGYATNVDNLEHSGRDTNDCDIQMDVPATHSNLNKGNHDTIISPGGGEDDKNPGTNTSLNEVRKSITAKNSTVTDTIGSAAACQMNVLTATSSTSGKMAKKEDGKSLENVEVPSLGCLKILPGTLKKDQNKGTNNQESLGKQEKSLIIPEKESSVVNKGCGMSSIALSKCGEMDLDYVIDCTDSQLIAAKPSSVSDGLRYDDLNLEDLMDCTDSQLVDIENLENQATDNQKSARDASSQALAIEDGTTLIQDLIKEVSSIKLYLMDVWNRYDQVKKRRHLTYTPVIKKRK